jgi:hypothetical protein
MKKIYLLILLIVTGTCLQAQTLLWAKQFGGTADEYGRSITVDATGNVYTTGPFEGTVDFNPGAAVFNLTSAGLRDIFVTKLDAAGNFVWAKQMGGTGDDDGRSIEIDAAGNVYTTGFFAATADFDPGAAPFNLTSAGFNDIFVSKLDAAGNFVWAVRMGGPFGDAGLSIDLDAAGNVYTSGAFRGTADFDPGAATVNLITAGLNDIFVSKLDAAGNFIYAKRMGSTNDDDGYSLTVDASGIVYTTGFFRGTADFDPGAATVNLTSAGGFDIFVSKLDATGNFVYAKQMGGTGDDFGYSIAIDAAGNAHTTGSFEGTADFDPGAATVNLTSAGQDDIFVSKIDAAGNFVWAKAMGGTGIDIASELALDAAGNVYSNGGFEVTVDFDPGAAVFNLTSLGLEEVFISKLDAAGNFVWAVRLGGVNGEVATGIALDALSNVHSTGGFEGICDFDPGQCNFNLTALGVTDAFVHKMNSAMPGPPPSVTINQAAAQADPTAASPINFTVVFNETVTGFATGDVTLSGTAGATTATVTGSGATYNVAVSGMTANGTVIATIAAGVAVDADCNTNFASTSTDNTVTYTGIVDPPPTVTINQAAAQADPTGTSPINFTVVFNEVVTGFATGDVTISGTAGATTATVTGSGTTYNVAVSGMTANGTVIATIAAGVAIDAGSNPNLPSTSTDNTVTYTGIVDPPPTVTINQAAAQADPTAASPINFAVVFNEIVTGFATGDVTLSGTAGATTATVTGSGTTYNVAVSGMTANGTVIATIAAGVAIDAGNNPNAASTSTDNTVTYTGIVDPPPTVTINQAAAQADPTAASPINFTVVFNETVTGFATGDVTLSGTAGATTATVTGSGTTYNVAVSGMMANGTVIATIAAGVAIDAGSNPNTASTSTDNTVTYNGVVDPPPTVTINQAAAQADPTGTSPINFTVVFNEVVTGFATGDVTLSGTAGAITATVTGSGTTYNVAVSGTTVNGTVMATIAAGVAIDAGSNPNLASTSTDNSVQFNLVTCTITCPANITISNTSGQCGAFVTYAAPTITGTCGTVTASHASGSFFPVGATTVTVTSTAGPSCTFTVTVIGGTAKVNLFPIPSNGNLNIAACNEMAGATVIAYNSIGQKIAQFTIAGGLNTYQFNWQAGIYFMEFIKGSLREVKTILITR